MVVRIQESSRRTALYYSLFVVALVLAGLFQSGSVPADRLKVVVRENLASVIGVSSAVPPNQFNSLAQQLAQKDLELSSREEEIIERERQLGEAYTLAIERNQRTLFSVIGAVALVLLLLILLNFYLDHVREAREARSGTKVHTGELQTRL